MIRSLLRESGIYAFKEYGHFVTIDTVDYNETMDNYIAKMKVDYPLYIKDDRTKNEYAPKFVRLRDIGELIYSNEGKLTTYPTRRTCGNLIQKRLNFWRDEVEKIIISSTSSQIAKIERFSNFWNPIYFIISTLIDYDSVSESILQSAKPSNTIRYMKLLENLKIIEKIDDIYTYTPIFSLKYEELQDEYAFRDWIISLIIENRYSLLRDVFHLTHLERMIQTENSYYISSIHADELLYKSLDSITKTYSSWYSTVIEQDVRYWLKDLMSVNLIHHEDNYYYGNEKAFKEMMDHKYNLPERIPPIVKTAYD